MRSSAKPPQSSRARQASPAARRASRTQTSTPQRAQNRSPRAAIETANRAANLARQVRRAEPSYSFLDGDFDQAVADGAVDAARVSLERRVRAHMPRASLDITFTDNRYTMISVRREPKARRYRLRVHHMFADAGPTVTRALARYVADNDAAASRMLGEFIDEHQHRVRPRRDRSRIQTVTEGDCFDLEELYDDLNRRYFGGTIDARISWGARSRRVRRRNSIKMGSYSVEDRLIRIHRTLDRPFVPRYFIEWIVYHEMLHQVHEAPIIGGRRRFHTKAFLEDEARYERYDEARAWERANIDRLLTY